MVTDEGLSAQRRPGPKSRRHLVGSRRCNRCSSAQRRPGPKSRRHLVGSRRCNRCSSAQRRPGPKSRRHRCAPVGWWSLTQRAQRRPGPKSRRHRGKWRRSTRRSPGAQRRPGPKSRRHTGRRLRTRELFMAALNEGRDRNPGDTRMKYDQRWLNIQHAQRRPGPKSRRHTIVRRDGSGETFHAQRRPGPKSRRHRRSPRVPLLPCGSLNEGRDRNPGDTINPYLLSSQIWDAQRRPGPKSRRHNVGTVTDDQGVHAQRRPGPKSRRHGVRSCGSCSGCRRSTKAGTEIPATPPRVPCPRTGVHSAQRRPGPKSRRHLTDTERSINVDQVRSTKAGTEIPATPWRERTDARLS